MRNLAGDKECDTHIRKELQRCGIVAHSVDPGNTEVPYSTIGKLGDITFRRAWYYWMVDCKVPLSVAQELYAHPVGRCDIRVTGACGCPAPDEWVTYFDDEGHELCDEAQLEGCSESTVTRLRKCPQYRLVKDLASEGTPYITSYHIDSELALYIFAETMKRHNLV
jgi:hypothetical protein